MRRLAVISALAAAGCAGSALPALGQTATKISVGVNGSDDVTPLLWGKTSGMFARAGLDVDVQKFPSSSIALAALLGGSLDIVRGSLLPLISARSRGIPVQLVAPAELAMPEDPSEGMVVAKDSPITSGKQLNGATLPVPSLHDFNEIATRAWIDTTGGDSKTVHFIELPIASIIPAIADGRVPAGMVTNPFLKDGLTAGHIKVIGRPNQAIGKSYLIVAYVTTAAFIAAHHDAASSFARVLGQSGVYTTAHHAEAVAAVAPFWGITASVIADMVTSPLATTLDPKQIQPLIDAAARYGVITKSFRAEELIAPGIAR
jgi:NitT/TauT family transport system substrate-binding protein